MFHNDTGESLKKQWAVKLGKHEHTGEGLATGGDASLDPVSVQKRKEP